MNERNYLAERFEENRAHLRSVAYRMLGSLSEVDDAALEVISDPVRLGALDLSVVD